MPRPARRVSSCGPSPCRNCSPRWSLSHVLRWVEGRPDLQGHRFQRCHVWLLCRGDDSPNLKTKITVRPSKWRNTFYVCWSDSWAGRRGQKRDSGPALVAPCSCPHPSGQPRGCVQQACLFRVGQRPQRFICVLFLSRCFHVTVCPIEAQITRSLCHPIP